LKNIKDGVDSGLSRKESEFQEQLIRGLRKSVEDLNTLIQDLEIDHERELTEKNIKSLLEKSRLTDDFLIRTKQLESDLEASQKRVSGLQSQLGGPVLQKLIQAEIRHRQEREALIQSFKILLRRNEEVKKGIIEKYKQDVGNLKAQVDEQKRQLERKAPPLPHILFSGNPEDGTDAVHVDTSHVKVIDKKLHFDIELDDDPAKVDVSLDGNTADKTLTQTQGRGLFEDIRTFFSRLRK
jgi:hypothetical protein